MNEKTGVQTGDEIVWRCAEERKWIFWAKDVERVSCQTREERAQTKLMDVVKDKVRWRGTICRGVS